MILDHLRANFANKWRKKWQKTAISELKTVSKNAHISFLFIALRGKIKSSKEAFSAREGGRTEEDEMGQHWKAECIILWCSTEVEWTAIARA